MKTKHAFLLLASLTMAQAHAQTSPTLSLEELMNLEVVTASRSNLRINQAPSNIVVVTREEIRLRGYRTLAELMRDLPGFDFNTGEPAGEYPTHFIFRGISDVGQSKFLIMVDDIVQNDISNGWARNVGYNMSLVDVERVEFISGPGSSLYGSNAYAGVINVITRNQEQVFGGKEQPWRFNANLLQGVNNTISPEVMGAFRFESGLSVHMTLRYYGSEGDRGIGRLDPGNYFHNNFEPDSVLTTEFGNIANERAADGSSIAIPDGFNTSINDIYYRGRMEKGGFKLGWNFWDKQEGLGSEVVGYEYFANTEGISYNNHHRGMLLTTSYTTEFTDKVNNTSHVYFRNTSVLPKTGFVYTYQYQSVDNGTDPAVEDKIKGYNGEGYVGGFENFTQFELGKKNTLLAGLQLEQRIRQYWGISMGEQQAITSTIVADTWDSEIETVQPMYFSKNIGLTVQDEHRFSPSLRLTAGLRYDWDQFYGDVFNPRIALVQAPSEGFNFKLLYGQAFKAPTIFELYDEWRGNRALNPEKVTTSEIEVGYLFPRVATLKLNMFYNHLKDLIVVAENPSPSQVPIGPNGEKATYYQNIGEAGIYGAAVSGDLLVNDDLRVFGNYSLTLREDGEDIDNIAHHKVNAGVNYLFKEKLNINLRANWWSRIKAPETNRYFHPKTPASIAEVGYDYVVEPDADGYLDGNAVLNLALTGIGVLDKQKRWEPQLVVRNLLNSQYILMGRQSGSGTRPVDALQPTIQNPQGFIPAYHPQQGREIYAVIRYKF